MLIGFVMDFRDSRGSVHVPVAEVVAAGVLSAALFTTFCHVERMLHLR
jgi:hypothetical protein